MIETFSGKDKVLVSYLFDELGTAEARELEDEMLLDDELFERMQVVEMNLIDGYVREEMSTGERLRFEKKFLALPENKDKVNHAQMFHNSLRRLHEKTPEKPAAVVQERGWRRRVAELLRRPIPVLAFTSLVLFFTFVALYLMRPESRHPSNSNIFIANSAPTASNNVNTPPDKEPGSASVNATPPQQSLPVNSSPNEVPKNSSVELAKNEPDRYTKDVWLFNQDQRSAERSGGDPLTITLGEKTRYLRLRYELLGDIRERETFGVTIKNRYNDPIKLKNGNDKQEVRPVITKGKNGRRRFIIINVSASVLKDSGPYTFEIDEPNFSPRTFTIKR